MTSEYEYYDDEQVWLEIYIAALGSESRFSRECAGIADMALKSFKERFRNNAQTTPEASAPRDDAP